MIVGTPVSQCIRGIVLGKGERVKCRSTWSLSTLIYTIHPRIVVVNRTRGSRPKRIYFHGARKVRPPNTRTLEAGYNIHIHLYTCIRIMCILIHAYVVVGRRPGSRNNPASLLLEARTAWVSRRNSFVSFLAVPFGIAVKAREKRNYVSTFIDCGSKKGYREGFSRLAESFAFRVFNEVYLLQPACARV